MMSSYSTDGTFDVSTHNAINYRYKTACITEGHVGGVKVGGKHLLKEGTYL